MVDVAMNNLNIKFHEKISSCLLSNKLSVNLLKSNYIIVKLNPPPKKKTNKKTKKQQLIICNMTLSLKGHTAWVGRVGK